MSNHYRILTYRDPYKLQETSFWNEIKDIPQFCASDVMAMSLWRIYTELPDAGENYSSFIFTMDNLVKAAFPDWEGNIERQIEQHIALSRQIREWAAADAKRNNPPREDLFSALLQNRGALIDGLRMFTELNVDPDSLKLDEANLEQKVFVRLYEMIIRGDEKNGMAAAFHLDNTGFQDLKSLFQRLIEKKKDYEKDKLEEAAQKGNQTEIEHRNKRIFTLDDLNKEIAGTGIHKIVVHGIHQFKPLQLRLISELERMGVEIIFLFNYLPQYPHIYNTWARIYSWFDAPMKEDRDQADPVPQGRKPQESFELADAYAGLLDAEAPVNPEKRKKWAEAAKKVQVLRFENTSEMADYVARLIQKYADEHPNERVDMNKIPDKIYAASRDADELLKQMFPEYAGERHFLNYPIGQFFLNLYNMWDADKKELVIETANLRACALSGLINPGEEQRYVSTIEITEPLLLHVSGYSEVIVRLKHYRETFQKIQNHQLEFALKQNDIYLLACYNPKRITEEDISKLIHFVEELQKIAKELFGESDHIDFKAHFIRLQEFIQKRAGDLQLEEEKQLVEALLERFENLQSGLPLSGTMEDIRTGLFYYLNQSNREEPDWLVRNFEQIEGDILYSLQHDKAFYHFACLSDSLICRKTDDLLPWPLNDRFIHKAYTPIALVFQVYYSALCEHQEYMQYALFYGLFFNRARVKLSYVC